MIPTTLTPRKAPAQQRSRRMVETLLEAAARILETRGQAGFNTNLVAEAAGVSVGSLYQYFPGKAALLAALVRADSEAFAAALEAAVTDTGREDMPTTLNRLIALAVSHQLDRPVLARLLDSAERDLGLEAENGDARHRIAGALLTVLTRHADALPPLDSEEAARDLLIIVRALTDSAAGEASPDRTALTRRVTRAALGYLFAPTLDVAKLFPQSVGNGETSV